MIIQTVRIALQAIWVQKLRSMLTMLGIIIGVAAVIALVSLASGSSSSVTSQIQGLGSNLVVVSVGAGVGAARGATNAQSTGLTTGVDSLTLDQAAQLGRMSGIRASAPVIAGSGTLAAGNSTSSAGVTGTTPAYQQVLNYKLAAGRFISPVDEDSGQNVAVLGSQEATALFSGLNPIGQTMTINGVPFTVIGVLASKGSVFGQSQDTFAAIPLTVAEGLFGQTAVTSVYLSAAKNADMTKVQNTLTDALATWLGSAQNFTVSTQAQILSTLASVSSVMTTLLGGVASISLIVGGIGIMNIMLVSVTERTREIGIRKSIGASRGNVLLQFLVESLTLSGLGGILGVVVGWLASSILGQALGMSGSAFSPRTALLAFLFSLAVGLLFGIWPANRAADLHPVNALRAE